MEFKDQYRHPLWQKRRLEQLEISNFECDHCGSKEKQLHVHHKAYVKGRKIWEYGDTELKVLCEDCHARSHHLKDLLTEALLALDEADLESVLGYAQAKVSCFHPSSEIEVFSCEHAEGVANAFSLIAEEIIPTINGENIITSEQLYALESTKKGVAHG